MTPPVAWANPSEVGHVLVNRKKIKRKLVTKYKTRMYM